MADATSFEGDTTMKPAIAAMMMAGLCAASAEAQSVETYRDQVLAVANTELQAWISDPIFIYAIREQNEINAGITPRKIKILDHHWKEGGRRGPMVGEVLDRQGSMILRDRREHSGGVVTEIFLMDRYGLNVAQSDRTSDYWQGDEAKFTETFEKGVGAIHVSEVKYDESTGKVQTQVSMTVADPDSGAAIGAVTFGIDLNVLTN
jgi:hypothetical protein